MEPRFGYDFSQVRVHTGAIAAESARAVKAMAYTVGNDVVFAAGQYAPTLTAGQHVLAHELTHTIQQRGAAQHKLQRREVCDEDGVCRSEPDEELNYTPSEPNATPNSTPSQPAASATPNSSPSQPTAANPTSTPNLLAAAVVSLMPPGDCTLDEHRILQNEVDRACDRVTSCTQNDDCPTIWQRIEFNAECIRARSIINARCFRGGNLGHIIALTNAVAALGNCWLVWNRKCTGQRTVPVRVPVPATRPVTSPVVDRGFMERMAAITGLTGTALVVYLLISEGTRLFPPRNLIPVP